MYKNYTPKIMDHSRKEKGQQLSLTWNHVVDSGKPNVSDVDANN